MLLQYRECVVGARGLLKGYPELLVSRQLEERGQSV